MTHPRPRLRGHGLAPKIRTLGLTCACSALAIIFASPALADTSDGSQIDVNLDALQAAAAATNSQGDTATASQNGAPGNVANAYGGPQPDTSAVQVPTFKPLVYEDDFSAFANPKLRTSAWSKLKYIPLGNGVYLTLGGQARVRSEYRDHLNFGRGTEDSGFNWQHRILLSADLHVTPNLRLFGELQATNTHGEDAPTNAVDSDEGDVHQAFVDLNLPIAHGSVLLRAGRQEITFGKARLFDTRNGPNTRRSFDALRFDFTSGPWSFGAIAGHPAASTLGWFNDDTERKWSFFAFHGGRSLDPILKNTELELFYIHTDRKDAPLAIYNAKRDTYSARISGKGDRFNYDLQLIGQEGRTYDGRKVRAWFTGLDADYHLPGEWKPTFGLRVDIGSGTKHPDSGTVGAYDFLWSRGQVYTAEFGYSNLAQVGPSFTISPASKLDLTVQETGLWRVTTQDTVYYMTNRAISDNDPQASNARSVGLRSAFKVNYRINRFITLGTLFNWVKRGNYLKDAGLTHDLFYNSTYVDVRF